MKRGTIKYVYVFILCMIFIITGCEKNNSNAVESEADFERTISAKFDEAEEAFSWFSAYGEIDMDQSDTVECEIGYYARVTQYDICTMKNLSNYMNRYFESTLCNELLNSSVEKDIPLFKEFDGKLYCIAGALGELSYNDGDKVLSIDRTKEEDRITLHVHYIGTFFEKTREVDIDYIMARGDDGIWRFGSEFVLPIEVASKM